MTPSILLTDSRDPDLASVAARTPGGRTEVRPSAELAAAMGELRGVMAVVVASADHDVVHAVAERGRLYRIPVILACGSDETCRLAGEVHA
ncbi:MAG TPA: hypothetical protein VF178_00630, partial [Gemmatimonadaceae bacterium]